MEKQLTINSKDAYKEWGVTLDNNALTALMTPAGNKEPVINESRTEHGKRVANKLPRMESRELTLTINLTAKNEQDFFAKYDAFCEELQKGNLDIQTSFQKNKVYHCYYVSCTQFSQFMRGIASFALKLVEPNPNNRK